MIGTIGSRTTIEPATAQGRQRFARPPTTGATLPPHSGRRILNILRYVMLAILVAAPIACSEPTAAQRSPAADDGPAFAADARSPAHGSVLAEVRRATQRFRDVEVAVAEGYLRDPTGMCIDAPMEGLPHQLGGLGVHYFRPDLLGITALEPRVDGTGTHTDFTRPAILVYEPQADGSMELVAIENLVFAAAWQAAGNNTPPSFLGNEYYLIHDNPETELDEAHGLTPHYELHVWLYRQNPSGMFMQFNPRVSCEHHSPHSGAH